MEVPQVPESLKTTIELHTRWSDEDNQGVLNNAVYLTLFEEGRHAYFSRLGLLVDNHFPFLLLQSNLRFSSPGRGGEDVRLELGTTHLGRTSFTQAYRLRSLGGEVWCEGEALLVLYDPETMAPREMPAEFRAAVAEFEGIQS